MIWLSLIGLGTLAGWWARGRRHRIDRWKHYEQPNPAEDDLIAVRHLSQETFATQRRMASQLNDLATRVELLSRQVENPVTPAIQPQPPGGITADWERSSDDRNINARLVQRTTTAPQHNVDWALIEAAANEFLAAADSREFDNAAVGTFFAERGAAVSFVLQLDNRWAMIAIHPLKSEGAAIGIPAIRIGMRQIDLQPYFDFVSYNGLDPIRGTQLVRLAHLTRTSGKWTATQKGTIDGSK